MMAAGWVAMRGMVGRDRVCAVNAMRSVIQHRTF